MSTMSTVSALPAPAGPLPLRHRLYARYCDGASATTIAREFGLDRQTVTRHLRVLEEQLSREHTADLARLRIRAVQAQYRIQSTALDALAHEEELEAASLAAQAAARAAGEQPLPPLYRAQRARLLAVAAHAARTAAQLEGLFTQPSAALVQEKPWLSPTPYPRPGAFAMRRPPDPAPDRPLDVYDPTDPDDLPDPPDEEEGGADPSGADPATDPPNDDLAANPPDGPTTPPAFASLASPTHRPSPPQNPVAFCGMPASSLPIARGRGVPQPPSGPAHPAAPALACPPELPRHSPLYPSTHRAVDAIMRWHA